MRLVGNRDFLNEHLRQYGAFQSITTVELVLEPEINRLSGSLEAFTSASGHFQPAVSASPSLSDSLSGFLTSPISFPQSYGFSISLLLLLSCTPTLPYEL